MWDITVRSAVDVVGGFFVALVVERMLGVLHSLGTNAPNAGSSDVVSAIATVQDNFLLLILLGIVVAFLARAQVEAQLA